MLGLVLILYFASVAFVVALFLAPIVTKHLWEHVSLRQAGLRGTQDTGTPMAPRARRPLRNPTQLPNRGAPRLYVV